MAADAAHDHDHAGHDHVHDAVTAVTEVATGHASHAPDPMQVDKTMALWTWVTFFILLALLYKVAWKPILAGLDKREQSIRDAVDNAAKLRDELAELEAKRTATIAEADAKAKEIVETARQAAVEAANVIENKAREEAKILMENAQREIKAAQEKAESTLRRESADVAIALAGKLVRENLDDERNRTLVDSLINEI